jgi:hypothetical protein
MVLLILTVFCIALVTSIRLKNRYKKLSEQIASQNNDGSFEYKFIQAIIKAYKKTMERGIQTVNTQATIEHFLDKLCADLLTAERFIKQANSLLIIMGLLGTFIGLTSAVGELSSLITGSDTQQWLEVMDSIGGGLLSSLEGMGVAFITSLVGIASSIILTVIFIFLKPEQSRLEFMTEMEEYLDHQVASECMDNQKNEFAILNDNLKKTFDLFGNQIGQAMGQAVSDIQHTTQALEKSIVVFDGALNMFGKNIGDFLEFNINLRNNISRMDVNFIKLTEALQDLTQAERQSRGE